MRRQILIALATAVVAAALAAGATVLLTDDGDDLAVATPPLSTQTPLATTSAGATESPSATGGSTRPAPAPGSTAAPATNRPTTSPSTQIRSAKSVDCDSEENKCSQPYGMSVEDGKLQIVPVDDPPPDYSGVPKISMSSEFRKKDESEASNGDDVHSIHVEVVVQNNTEKTFVFAKREIALDIYKDGKLYDSLVTTGPGFDMTPGGKMTATFDRPITSDGHYLWQAKTWYYEK